MTTIQVASQRTDDSEENVVELHRLSDNTVLLSIENEDGEAADQFTHAQWCELEDAVRKIMGWER